MLFVLDIDFDEILAAELTSQYGLRKRILDIVFNCSSERSCTELWIIAFVDKEMMVVTPFIVVASFTVKI